MGYNTTVFILNDHLDHLNKNPDKFMERINEEMHGGSERWRGGSGVTVMKTAHADVFRLYATHQNSIMDLSPYCDETMALATGTEHQREFVDRTIAEAEDYLRRLKRNIKNARLDKDGADG